LEFLSRGCCEVICVEKAAAHQAFIRSVQTKLQDSRLTVIRSDVFRYIAACRRTFDFIFADPPYALPELAALPALIFERQLLKPGGLFILEHPKAYDFSGFPGFLQHRAYGAVNFSLMEEMGAASEV
jgi:16S rRNA G966 N2-methylase RsmD